MILALLAPFMLCVFGKGGMNGISAVAGMIFALILLGFYVIWLIRLTPSFEDPVKSAGAFAGRLIGIFFLIYLILAAQFESFKDPFIIMLTVPLAIAGALIFMYTGGITMNIFSQIGIIMLIGLVAKNGILIVEFANQKQESGENKMQAIRDAALQRLRPILMTSASTVLGLIPLAFATGEGANQRIAMGTAVVGGMLVSTFLTMYIVPAIYSYISTNRNVKTETV
jgi:multidrug efflux pump